ncbi:MAG: LPS export ABC transporter permease LptG [Deltaproteobacteria bacterium]|nr:LPS export ABC transporter permease LptG [Deltaproteobacteria bacterium]
MKIIDRYITREFLLYFLIALSTFTSLFLLVDILQRSMKEGLSVALLQFTLLQGPFVISQMVPVACLMASMFALTALAKNSELIAMYATGISTERLAVVLVTVASLIGIGNFFLADLIVPPTLKKAKYVYHVDVKKQGSFQIFKTSRIWYRSPNAIYNIDYFSPENQSASGVHIYLFDNAFKLIEQISAKTATFDGTHWSLHEGKSTTLIDDFPITHSFLTKKAEYITEKPVDLKELSNLETLSFKELKDYIARNKLAGFDTIRHEVNLHAKISYAVACLIMAFLGIPFSTKSPRAGGLASSLGIGLAIAFSYWMFLNMGLSLGYKGTFTPVVSAWIANLFFAVLAIYFIKREQRMDPIWPF